MTQALRGRLWEWLATRLVPAGAITWPWLTLGDRPAGLVASRPLSHQEYADLKERWLAAHGRRGEIR